MTIFVPFNNRKDFNKSIENIRIDFEHVEIDTIVVETEYEESKVIEILNAKYGDLTIKPKIKINPTRHMPDYS